MPTVKEVLDIKTEEFMKKSYDELSLLVDDDVRFTEEYDGKTFNFVIRVKRDNGRLKIVVECSNSNFLQHLFFKFKCFAMDKAGKVYDTEPF